MNKLFMISGPGLFSPMKVLLFACKGLRSLHGRIEEDLSHRQKQPMALLSGAKFYANEVLWLIIGRPLHPVLVQRWARLGKGVAVVQVAVHFSLRLMLIQCKGWMFNFKVFFWTRTNKFKFSIRFLLWLWQVRYCIGQHGICICCTWKTWTDLTILLSKDANSECI